MAMTKPTSDQITFLNTVTLPGDLAVNGADITTSATGTATVFNANATTLNIGGAATTVSLGAATGTTTINNANTVVTGDLAVNGANTVVTGDLAVNGADITTASTGTATVFNTNATTLNVGGAATTLSLGAATGTASVNNATFQFNSGYGSVATAYGVRAWANFDGTLSGPISPRANGNVSSVTDNGTGDYTINMINAMPDTNYATIAMGNNASAGLLVTWKATTSSTTQTRLQCLTTAFAAGDNANVFVAVIR
jgi:hypothetical protein